MWIITPSAAYNTERYRSIWATGKDSILRLLPVDACNDDDAWCDLIMFDSKENAIKAFDAVMNGIRQSSQTLLLLETNKSLRISYDEPYETITDHESDRECIIKNPREWNDDEPDVVLLFPRGGSNMLN